MSSIDKRIVEMQFNNQGFEKGVNTTLNSLKKLQEGLKLKGSSKGLEEVSSGMNKLSSTGFGTLSNGLSSITSGFSALGVIGVTALANITNSAVNAGKNLVKALTIEPIMTGFSEYETKMGSIQTILTNTAHQGTTLEDVTKTLDELNTYADKTIYNFAEMTRNIGTFTAAGVDLDTSTAAIKGIANLAAASGSTSAQASTAMYQLSQALAAGKVGLQDWNSVVNAGMGGKLFQDALLRTSEQLGTGGEAMVKKFGSFRESLTRGEWLTTEVLTETLKQLSGAYTEADLIAQGYTKSQAKQIVQLAENASAAATEVKTVTQLVDTMKESVQSGWAQTWEYIIGDKDQATKTLTAVSQAFENLIGPSTEARNAMFKFWNEHGGREDVIKGLTNVFGSLGKGLGSIGKAFREVFPAMTGERLVEISKGFKNLTEKFKMSDSTAKKIKSTFKGLFSVLKIGVEAVKGLFKGLSPMVDVLLAVGRGFVTVTGFIGDFVSKIAGAVTSTNIFTKIGEGISTAFGSVGKVLSGIGDVFGNFISGLSFDSFGTAFDTIGKGLAVLGTGIKGLLDGIGDAIGTIDFGVIMKGINALLGVGILNGIRNIVKSFKEVGESFNIFEKIGEIGDNVSEILDTVKSSLKAYQNSLNATTLLKIAGAIGILAASLLLLSSIKPENMENALVGITVIFAELVGALAILLKLSGGSKLKGIFTLTTTMIALSVAILILSAALKNISGLDWGQLGRGLIGLASMLGMLVATLKLLDKKDKILIKTSIALVIFAGAIRSLSKAVESMGKLKPEVLLQGLIGVGVVLAELVAFMKLTNINKMGIKSAAGLLILAGAVNALALAVGTFGKMDPNAMVRGLIGVAAVLTELGVFMKLTGNSSGILRTSAAMILMGAAMNILAGAIRSIATVSWENLGKSLLGMAASLTIFGLAANMINGGKLIIVAAGVATMSAALLVLSAALKSLGNQSWESVAISLVSLAGALTVLGVAMYAMSGCLLGAAALTAVSLALSLLVPQLIALGSMSLGQIGTSLIALAGAFAVVGIAGAVLTPVIPAILGLAAAMGVLGLACVAIGAGLLAFGTGLSLVAASGGAAIGLLINGIKELIGLLPELGTNLGLMAVNILQALSQNLPTIITAIGTLITGILQAFTTAIPQIANVAVTLIITLANTIASNASRIIQAGIDLAVSLINGLADGIRNNVPAIVGAVENLASAILEALYECLPDWLKTGMDLVDNLINGMGQKEGDTETQGGKIADAAKNGLKKNDGEFKPIGSGFIDKVIAGITGKNGEANTAGGKAADAAKNGVKSKESGFKPVGSGLIQRMVDGIRGQNGAANSAGGKAADAAKNGANSRSGQFQPLGSGFITKMISGIRGMYGGATSAGKGAANSAKSGAQSGSSGFSGIGRSMVQGMISGMGGLAGSLYEKAKSIAQKAYKSAKNALQINSPSKLFMRLGSGTIEGFVKGISDNMSDVVKSSEGISNSAYKAVSRTIGAVTEAMNTNMDMNPTITPVLDLTNIQNGSRTIGSLLSSGNGLTLSADASGAISRTIGNIQNGNDNSDILSALKDLKEGLSNTGNTTYSINGITYDDGSNVSNAVETLVRAARIERRI